MADRNVSINVKGWAPVVCAIGAVIVAASGGEGWGWFLFVAVLLA